MPAPEPQAGLEETQEPADPTRDEEALLRDRLADLGYL
jgi:hypothetical protein